MLVASALGVLAVRVLALGVLAVPALALGVPEVPDLPLRAPARFGSVYASYRLGAWVPEAQTADA